MLKKILPLALAAGMIGFTGCAEPGERVAGGGAGEGRTAAEQAAAQEAVNWGTTLTGDKRTLAESVARLGWLQANLAARQWEQAGEDLADIEDNLARLADDPDVPANVKQELAGFQPMITEMGQQLLSKDAMAIQTAAKISDRFDGLMANQMVVAWLSEGQTTGGGAGQGGVETDMRQPVGGTTEHDNTHPVTE